MSKHKELTGQGGKGSVNRVSDIRKYQAEFDRIFGSKPSNKQPSKDEK